MDSVRYHIVRVGDRLLEGVAIEFGRRVWYDSSFPSGADAWRIGKARRTA